MRKRGILLILMILFSSGVLAILGDFTGDGCVKFDDFLEFAKHYSEKVNDTNRLYNLDDTNNFIDLQDFLIFAENYGKCGINASISVFTTKDVYSIGEVIKLR